MHTCFQLLPTGIYIKFTLCKDLVFNMLYFFPSDLLIDFSEELGPLQCFKVLFWIVPQLLLPSFHLSHLRDCSDTSSFLPLFRYRLSLIFSCRYATFSSWIRTATLRPCFFHVLWSQTVQHPLPSCAMEHGLLCSLPDVLLSTKILAPNITHKSQLRFSVLRWTALK